MEAVNLNLESLNLYHWAVLAGVICSIVGAWFITRYVQQGHEVRLTKVEARHEVLSETLAAHKLHVSDIYARKDDVREAVNEVKVSVEKMESKVLDAIINNNRTRSR